MAGLKRQGVLLGVVFSAGLLLSGCLGALPSDKAVIRFSTWGSAEELTVLKQLIGQFEAEHPQVRVELVHIPENYFQKLHILIAGGLTPDVMFINSLSFPVYADNQIFLPLDDWLGGKGSDVHPGTFFPQSLQAFRWENTLYAVPRDVSNLVVFYNRDLFQQAELAEPRPDWTMSDLVRMGQRLTKDLDGDGSRDQFGFSFYGKPPLMWLPFAWSAGGDVFAPDFSGFRLNTPEAIDGLQFYADLRHKWHVAPTREEVGSATMSQLFLQGKLAMMVSGRWSVPILRDQAQFNWDVAPFPRGKAGSVVGIDASGYALSRTTRYPKESWALVAFLSSRRAQEAFAQSGLIVPARKDVATSPTFLASPPAHGRYFIEVIAPGRPSHTPPRWNEISEELGLAVEPVWEGSKTAREALKTVTPKIERLLHE